MLNQDLPRVRYKICQLQNTTFPPHINFVQLKPNNSLKQIQYLVKLEDVLPTQGNDSHPILVYYDDDQFILLIYDKGNSITYTPLVSFIFPFVSTFLSKYKKLF